MTAAKAKPLPPQPHAPDAKDKAHAAARMALEAVPYAGGSLAVLFEQVIAPSLDKRRHEWLDDLAEHVRRLEAEDRLTLDDLKSEAVVDAMLQASRAAVSTSSAEKRAALRNAVLNTARPGAPIENERFLFVRYVADFNEWHLRILKLFHDPAAWERRHGTKFPDQNQSSLARVLYAAFPELASQQDFCNVAWSDLYRAGFVNTDSLHGMMSGQGVHQRRSTELGARFLTFIAEP